MVQLVVDGSARLLPLREKSDKSVWLCSWSYMECKDEPKVVGSASLSSHQLTGERVALLAIARDYPVSMWSELTIVSDQLTLIEYVQVMRANPDYVDRRIELKATWTKLIQEAQFEGITADEMVDFCLKAKLVYMRAHADCVEMEYADYVCDQYALSLLFQEDPEALLSFALEGFPPYQPMSYATWQKRGLVQFCKEDDMHRYYPVSFTEHFDVCSIPANVQEDRDAFLSGLIANLRTKGFAVVVNLENRFKRGRALKLVPLTT